MTQSIVGGVADWVVTLPKNGKREDRPKLIVTVSIKAQRMAYGRQEYQVTPVVGSGLVWIQANHLTLRHPAHG